MRNQYRAVRPFAVAALAVLTASCIDSTTVPRAEAPVLTDLSTTAVRGEARPTDRHVFLMHGESISSEFATEVVAAGGAVLRSHDEIGVAVVTGLSDAAAEQLAKGHGKVERDVLIQWVPTAAQAGLVVLDAAPPVEPLVTAKHPSTAALAAFQWNMRQVSAPQAWATRTGNPIVRVAIIDTGLDPDHIEQKGTIDVASSIAFTPSTGGPPTWADDQYHGTHVGSIVTSNNIVTAGIAPNVTLIAIKVLAADGFGSFSDVIAGLLHAGNVRADVANLSLGVEFPKSGAGRLVAALNRAVNYANRHDVLVVSAAGNEFTDLQHNRNGMYIPCESGTGMCVSATGPFDTKASYSNFGASAIHVAAPGGDYPGSVLTHYVIGPCSSRGACRPSRGSYIGVVGTSQAAPHVSGLAAFLDSQYGGTLNPAQLQSKLQQCSDDIGKPGTDQFYGNGRINAFNTVNEVNCNNSGI